MYEPYKNSYIDLLILGRYPIHTPVAQRGDIIEIVAFANVYRCPMLGIVADDGGGGIIDVDAAFFHEFVDASSACASMAAR